MIKENLRPRSGDDPSLKKISFSHKYEVEKESNQLTQLLIILKFLKIFTLLIN